MANNKLQIVNDILGVLRGLYIVQSHSAQIQPQKRLTLQRTLTESQRQQIEHEREIRSKNQEMFTQNVQESPVQHIEEPVIAATEIKATIEQPQQISKPVEQAQVQETELEDEDDVPFFMKQDRPKFTAQERYVPSTASSRAFQFGILGVQLIGGTVTEAIKQKIGLSQESLEQQGKKGLSKYAINENNANKLQQTFRRMRGAVLKLGQILSTGDTSIVPPVIRDAMEKARSEADIMPVPQVMKILETEYGSEWQKKFREINLYPFAAASIGQVHEAIIKSGVKVALKMQYTGVADSIDSDLNNFKRLVGCKEITL